MEKETLLVEGMHCAKCSGAVNATLGDLPGVSEVLADHKAGTVDVCYDPALVDRERIAAEITDLGFTVTG